MISTTGCSSVEYYSLRSFRGSECREVLGDLALGVPDTSMRGCSDAMSARRTRVNVRDPESALILLYSLQAV